MEIRPRTLAAAWFVMSLACTSCSAQLLPSLPCFNVDSGRIVYGTITTDIEWGYRGVRLSFEIDTARLRGWVRDTFQGTLQPEIELDSLVVIGSDSLSFSYPNAHTRNTYRVHLTCLRLEGMARLAQTGTSPGVLTYVIIDRRLAPRKL